MLKYPWAVGNCKEQCQSRGKTLGGGAVVKICKAAFMSISIFIWIGTVRT